jgi:hypothetical protein
MFETGAFFFFFFSGMNAQGDLGRGRALQCYHTGAGGGIPAAVYQIRVRLSFHSNLIAFYIHIYLTILIYSVQTSVKCDLRRTFCIVTVAQACNYKIFRWGENPR